MGKRKALCASHSHRRDQRAHRLFRDTSHKDSPEDIKMPLSSSSTSSTKSIRRAPSELERSDSITVSLGSVMKGIVQVWVERRELVLRADGLAG